jgi:hypothetical protein
MEQDPEELLEVGGGSRRRILWWGLALVVVLGLLVARLVTDDADHRADTPPEVVSVTPSGPAQQTAVGACGATVPLPVVDSDPVREATGIRVLAGGQRLREVDFDDGRVTTLPDQVVKPGEYAAVLPGEPLTAYATTRSCDETTPSAMLRISVDRRVRLVRSLGPAESLLTDGNRVWIVSFAADAQHPYATIMPITGGKRVQLPLGFYPSAVVGTTVVGALQNDPNGPPTWLALVDALTGRIATRVENQVTPLAVGGGQLVWTDFCQEGPCVLQHRPIAGGEVDRKVLPNPVCCGVVSADGEQVALVVDRGTARDIAVLHLRTGELDVVPGVELPAQSHPGLAWTRNGEWLVMALDAGTRTRLLAWRADLTRPVETTALEGPVEDPPSLVITSR